MKKIFLITCLLSLGYTYANTDVICPMQYAPVCGVDGKTYSNSCVAVQQNNVKVSHEGECAVLQNTLTGKVEKIFTDLFAQNTITYSGNDSKKSFVNKIILKLSENKVNYQKDVSKLKKYEAISAILLNYSKKFKVTTITTGTSLSGTFSDDVASDVVSLMVRNLRKVIGKKQYSSGSVMVAYNVLDQHTGDNNVITYYVWGLAQEYYVKDKQLFTGLQTSIPVAIKIQKKGDYYIPLTYQMPSVDNYTGDVQNIFPTKIQDKVLKKDIKLFNTMIDDMMTRVYISAKNYFGV